jgi:hypothetical protein
MQIEDLKRWHWIVAGIVVGLVLAYVWQGVEPPSVRNTSAAEFLHDVTQTDPKTKRPILQDIVVRPPEPNFDERNGGKVNVVTYRKWMRDRKTDERALVDRQFIADIPFVPPGQRAGEVDPNSTITGYLTELKKTPRGAHVSFNNGWWTTKPATYAIWTLGSVAVIGGLWPIVLGGLIGAGYGGRREAKADAYDLSRFGQGSTPEPAKPAPPKVSAAEQQRLREMTEQLETRLGGFGQVGPAQPAGATEAKADAPGIRKLDGGPLELAPAMAKQDEDEIEVKGEYYPVLIHHKKQNADTSSDAEKK